MVLYSYFSLTTRRVRHSVAPDVICQPGPSLDIKTHSSPAAFPKNSRFLWFSSPLSPFLHRPLVPQAAPSSTYSPARPLVPTKVIRRGQWEKWRSATADSYSLDASAALSRRAESAMGPMEKMPHCGNIQVRPHTAVSPGWILRCQESAERF